MSRFRIYFDGGHAADTTEFFPDLDDPDTPTAEDVDRVLREVTLDTFLNEWNYQEDLEVTVVDTVTGVRWVSQGFGGFRQVTA